MTYWRQLGPHEKDVGGTQEEKHTGNGGREQRGFVSPQGRGCQKPARKSSVRSWGYGWSGVGFSLLGVSLLSHH